MTYRLPVGQWVRRHPVLTVLWLILAGFWLAATVSVYDDDPVISFFAFVVPMTPVTLIILGLGVLGDRIRLRRSNGPDAPSPLTDRSWPVQPVMPDTMAVQRKLDDEARRQQDLTLQLARREAELGRREADLRLREALVQPDPQRQSAAPLRVPLPEAKPSFEPAVTQPPVTQPDRLPDQSAPARFCFNCGAWFARDDQTCRLCGARRVGAEA